MEQPSAPRNGTGESAVRVHVLSTPSAHCPTADAVAEVSCAREDGGPDQQLDLEQSPPETRQRETYNCSLLDNLTSPVAVMKVGLSPGSLASQLCPLGPKDRCTPSQAQAMGQQVLALLAMHEKNNLSLPGEFSPPLPSLSSSAPPSFPLPPLHS